MVQPERELDITWRQFSLALKNGALKGKDKTHSASAHVAAHRVHRAILAASKKGIPLIDLYTDFGIPYHIAGEKFDNELISNVLQKHSLGTELLTAADDESLDKELEESMNEAIQVAGEDIGVPTIVFVHGAQRIGFFGPVLQTLPDKPEALKLWDGLSQLASDENFYELKRSRPTGGPDVFSTAKC